MSTSVSVVIPAYNEGRLLHQTLDGLRRSTAVPFEVVVVDDGSTDGSCAYVRGHKRRFGPVTVVSQPRGGPAPARNLGAEHARGNVIVFLDAHCFPHRGWLERLLAAVRRYPDALVTPAVGAAGSLAFRGYGMRMTSRLSVEWVRTRPPGLAEVPVACACCCALRADLFDALGRFDTMRIYGLEDVELSMRTWLCGHRVLVEPDATVDHRFRIHTPADVPPHAYLYNLLRMVLLHFDHGLSSTVLAPLRHTEAFALATKELLESDFWDRYDLVSRLRRHPFGWYRRRFGLDA